MLIADDQTMAIQNWVAHAIPHVGPQGFGPAQAMGVVSDREELQAGVVFHDYQPEYGTMQVSVAASTPMWAKPDHIKAIMAYPFEQIGVYKLWSAIPHTNERAIKFNKHIGFKQEAVLAHHFGHKVHAVITRLYQPDYRRLYGDNHG